MVLRDRLRAIRVSRGLAIVSLLLALVISGCGPSNEPVGVRVIGVVKDATPRDYGLSWAFGPGGRLVPAEKATLNVGKEFCFATMELELTNTGAGNVVAAFKDLRFGDAVEVKVGGKNARFAGVPMEDGNLFPIEGVSKELSAGERWTVKIVVVVKKEQKSMTVRYKRAAPVTVVLDESR